MSDIVHWCGAVLVVALIVGGSLYGCSQSRESYYAAMNSCIGAGGTWVPTTPANNDAACIGARR